MCYITFTCITLRVRVFLFFFNINWDYRPTEVTEQHPLRSPPPSWCCCNYLEETAAIDTRQTKWNSPALNWSKTSGKRSRTLTCPGDWPHLSLCWWDSRVPAGYWWWGCGASSYRSPRCPELVSLHYLHGNSTRRRFKKVVLKPLQTLGHKPGIPGICPKSRYEFHLMESITWRLVSQRLSWRTEMMMCCCTAESDLFTATLPRDSGNNDCKMQHGQWKCVLNTAVKFRPLCFFNKLCQWRFIPLWPKRAIKFHFFSVKTHYPLTKNFISPCFFAFNLTLEAGFMTICSSGTITC